MKILMVERVGGELVNTFRSRRPIIQLGEWSVVNASPICYMNTARQRFSVTHNKTGFKSCETRKASEAKEILMDIVTDAGVIESPDIPSEVLADPYWVKRKDNSLYVDELKHWADTFIKPVLRKWSSYTV